ncbi:hypothetical protein B4U79_17838 [Dinothrombium tinctorium]|uniref:Uncharacterized protein n=1 Tax=Dinothrombium tinctorium TaxID=1965070 RepID=A0A3S3SMY8_9ACAR|nr:hypothetical protein B4U79_17838 [Dinothrombium tinctorium]
MAAQILLLMVLNIRFASSFLFPNVKQSDATTAPNICNSSLDDAFWTHYSNDLVVFFVNKLFWIWDPFLLILKSEIEINKIWPHVRAPIDAAFAFDHRIHKKENLTLTLFLTNDTFWLYENANAGEEFRAENEKLVGSGKIERFFGTNFFGQRITALSYEYNFNYEDKEKNSAWDFRIRSELRNVSKVRDLLYIFTTDGSRRFEWLYDMKRIPKMLLRRKRFNVTKIKSYAIINTTFEPVETYAEIFFEEGKRALSMKIDCLIYDQLEGNRSGFKRLISFKKVYQYAHNEGHTRLLNINEVIFGCYLPLRYEMLEIFIITAFIIGIIEVLSWLFTKKQVDEADQDFDKIMFIRYQPISQLLKQQKNLRVQKMSILIICVDDNSKFMIRNEIFRNVPILNKCPNTLEAI